MVRPAAAEAQTGSYTCLTSLSNSSLPTPPTHAPLALLHTCTQTMTSAQRPDCLPEERRSPAGTVRRPKTDPRLLPENRRKIRTGFEEDFLGQSNTATSSSSSSGTGDQAWCDVRASGNCCRRFVQQHLRQLQQQHKLSNSYNVTATAKTWRKKENVKLQLAFHCVFYHYHRSTLPHAALSVNSM